MQIENLEVSIRLPVGANNVKVTPPYHINRREDGIYFNYMDSIGIFFQKIIFILIWGFLTLRHILFR